MLKIDLHIHTLTSGDANGTVYEYIQMAKKRDLEVIGFSEHGPSDNMSNATDRYLNVLRRIPKTVDGIRILKGVEANVFDKGLDIKDETIDRLDYVIAGFHEQNLDFDKTDIESNTKILIKTIESGKINILSHPYLRYVEIDIEKVAQAACDNDVLLEVNISYFQEGRLQDWMIPKIKKMIEIVKKNNKKVIVNSDSHNIWELGDDSNLEKYKEEIGLTDELIINNYPDELFELLGVER